MLKVNCKALADELLDQISEEKKKPLWIVRKHKGDPAADAYINGIKRDCNRCGIAYEESEQEPYPLHGLVTHKYGGVLGGVICDDQSEKVSFLDIDRKPFPCVVEAVLYIMEMELGFDFGGKTVLLIGRSETNGKPLFNELLKRNCTITLAHSQTLDLDSPRYLTGYDVIITSAGVPKLIDLNKCFADLIIDVGVNQDESGKLCGDTYNFDACDGSTMKVACLPGGVGLLTRAILLDRVKGEDDR